MGRQLASLFLVKCYHTETECNEQGTFCNTEVIDNLTEQYCKYLLLVYNHGQKPVLLKYTWRCEMKREG